MIPTCSIVSFLSVSILTSCLQAELHTVCGHSGQIDTKNPSEDDGMDEGNKEASCIPQSSH